MGGRAGGLVIELSLLKLIALVVVGLVVFYTMVLPFFSVSKGRNPTDNNLDLDLIDLADVAIDVAEITDLDNDLL